MTPTDSPDTARVYTLDYMQQEYTGKWAGLAYLIYGSKGPIHDAAYVAKLVGWAVFPKGVRYTPNMYQLVKLSNGGIYTPIGYGNTWSQSPSALAVNNLFKSWKPLPADEYSIRLYFKDGSKPQVFDL